MLYMLFNLFDIYMPKILEPLIMGNPLLFKRSEEVRDVFDPEIQENISNEAIEKLSFLFDQIPQAEVLSILKTNFAEVEIGNERLFCHVETGLRRNKL